MTIEDLNEFWKLSLRGCDPEAHNLKYLFQNRWVRFHALPESKRYPEFESEYQEILFRHNTVLRELNGLSNKLTIILPEYSEEREPRSLERALQILFPETEFWCSLVRYDRGEKEEFFWHLYAAIVQYSGRELNGLFRLVANDEVRNVIVVSLRSQSVFHPYDGGTDIILPTTAARNQFKRKHIQWLSKHPDGY